MRAGPEHQLQKAVVQYLALLEATGKLFFFAIPNQGNRSRAAAQMMKSQGLRAGIYDLAIIKLPEGTYHALEIKAPKGSLSRTQKGWREFFEKHNIPFAVCKSMKELGRILGEWGMLK